MSVGERDATKLENEKTVFLIGALETNEELLAKTLTSERLDASEAKTRPLQLTS